MDRKASPVNREQKKIVPGKKDKLQKWRICKRRKSILEEEQAGNNNRQGKQLRGKFKILRNHSAFET